MRIHQSSIHGTHARLIVVFGSSGGMRAVGNIERRRGPTFHCTESSQFSFVSPFPLCRGPFLCESALPFRTYCNHVTWLCLGTEVLTPPTSAERDITVSKIRLPFERSPGKEGHRRFCLRGESVHASAHRLGGDALVSPMAWSGSGKSAEHRLSVSIRGITHHDNSPESHPKFLY
jgi:hypothetical protein